MFHGTRQVLDQLVFSVKAEQSLFFQTKKLKNESEATTQFFSKYIRFHGSTAKLEGKCKRVVLPRKIHQAIEDYAGKRLTNYHQIVSRLRRNPSSVIHSEYFAKKLRVHDSSVCCFRDITGEVGFARILVFESTYSIAIAIPYVTAEHFLENIRGPRNPELRLLYQQLRSRFKKIFLVMSLQRSNLIVFPISSILNICVSLKLFNNCDLLVLFPNNIEYH